MTSAINHQDQRPATAGRSDKTTIYLALTHDWELRGDGSGDIEQIQFAPLRKLLEIYRQHNTRTTFLPDVMQQIAFRRLEAQHPDLKPLADKWDEHVRDALRQRHDIQLHLHPQWLSAKYENGRWVLNGDWPILNYDRPTALAMLADGKNYLETLLQPIKPDYSCVAFRAGALTAAPSDHLFESLINLGIKIDASIAAGLVVNDERVKLNYRHCDETFLPFYPSLNDARRVSPNREEIVCVPLNHFYGSRRAVTRQNISLVRQRLVESSTAGRNQTSSENAINRSRSSSRLRASFDKLIRPVLRRKYFVSDTGRLNYALMREMLASIRQRAASTGLAKVPVLLTNHPKDIRDWAGLERFVGEVSRADDIEFITLSELAKKIEAGEFQVRVAS